jgi:hypothetical protein
MAFYEVHDEDGCLSKTRQLAVAKRAALAFLTMKAGRTVRIQMYADNARTPRRTILLDSTTRSWLKPGKPAQSAAPSA